MWTLCYITSNHWKIFTQCVQPRNLSSNIPSPQQLAVYTRFHSLVQQRQSDTYGTWGSSSRSFDNEHQSQDHKDYQDQLLLGSPGTGKTRSETPDQHTHTRRIQRHCVRPTRSARY